MSDPKRAFPRLRRTALIGLGAGALLAGAGWAAAQPQLALFGRWLGLAALVLWGVQRRSLTAWILISMALGAEVGHDWPQLGASARIISLAFLRLIKCIIAPLLFGTLVTGIAGHSSLRQVGRMGIRSLIYFEVITTLALFLGLAAINLTQAGAGVQLPATPQVSDMQAAKQSASELFLHIFPENIAKSVAEGQVLQVVVFAILFAIALALVDEQRRRPLLAVAESLAAVMFKFTRIVMFFAPVGVGAAIAYTVGHLGLGILLNLFKLLATLYLALVAFLLFVLLPVTYLARVPLRPFVRALADPVSLAFATTCSEAALPLAMENMQKLGVPRQIVAFVMPMGYSFNLDGSTLYLSLASVFVAQAAGIHLSLGQQLLIAFTLMLTSKGIAGVPRATLLMLLGTAASFGLPEWPIFAILGIDELMDMARTSVNVIGNCVATVVIARWEGQLVVAPKQTEARADAA